MNVSTSDPSMDGLESVLRRVADSLEFPAEGAIVGVVVGRIGSTTGPRFRSGILRRRPSGVMRRTAPRRWGPLMIAAIVCLALVLPGPRRALARWVGIGAVRLEVDTPLPTVAVAAGSVGAGSVDPATETGSSPTLDAPVGVDAAEQATGVVLPSSGVLGPPAVVQVTTYPLERAGQTVGVLEASWRVMPSLPATGLTDVGARLWITRGSIDRAYFAKFASGDGSSSARVEDVVVKGVSAVFISGPRHVIVFLDPAGHVINDTARLAGNTVLWAVDGVTYRLETALERDEAVALAASFDI